MTEEELRLQVWGRVAGCYAFASLNGADDDPPDPNPIVNLTVDKIMEAVQAFNNGKDIK